MKKCFRVFACMLVLAAYVSCSIKEEKETSATFEHKIRLILDPEVKTAITADGDRMLVNWTEGDQILYYSSSLYPRMASVSLEGKNAYVSMSLGLDDAFIHAIYGASSISDVSSGSFHANTCICDIQSYTSFSQAHVCAAFSGDVFDSGLHFHNVSSILTFTSAPEIYKVVIHGNNNEIINGGTHGEIEIVRSSDMLSAVPGVSGSNTVTVNTNGSSEVFFVSILPVSFQNGFTVECYNSANEKILTKSTNVAINTSAKPIILNLGKAQEWLYGSSTNEYYSNVMVMDFNSASKTLPYNCNKDSLSLYSQELSHYCDVILDDYYGLTWKSFSSQYQPVWKNGLYASHPDFNMKTYVCTGSGRSLSDYSCPTNGSGDCKYGTIRFYPEGTESNPNMRFVLSFNKAQKDALRVLSSRSQTLYARFYHNGDNIFLGFKVYLASDVVVHFAEHNPRYWYNDIDYNANTIRMYPRVPFKWQRQNPTGNSDVTDYSYNMLYAWAYNRISILENPSWQGATFEWSFPPQSEQPRIKDPNSNSSQRWSVGISSNYGDDDVYVISYKNSDPIISINSKTGIITYLHYDDPSHISNKLLNMNSTEETSIDRMLYCKVRLSAYEEDAQTNCRIKIGSEDMYVRFFRPVSFFSSTDCSFRDMLPTGDNLTIGRMFTAYDWNKSTTDTGYQLFTYDAATDTCAPCYYPEGGNDIEWYGYYGIKSISIDIDNILIDQVYSTVNFKQSYPSARIWLARKSDRLTELNPWDIDISTADKLGDYILVFYNSMGGLSGTILKVPVTVEYAWGPVSFYVDVAIR